METKHQLTAVLKVEEAKCVNCHACISACPVKECNDASGSYIDVDSDLCLACGQCIPACTHEARQYIDDFSAMIDDLRDGVKMVAIVSAAAVSNFPRHYLHLNGFLRSLGVEAVFDAGIGAELAAISLSEYISRENPKLVISPQCPSVVSYIELYKPELLKYIAPLDSPLVHTVKLIKRFYPEYEDHKIAYISSCNAVKREFDETRIGNYNVGIKSIQNYLTEHQLYLTEYPIKEYNSTPTESGSSILSSGGMSKLVDRYLPGFSSKSRVIEGGSTVYPYLDHLMFLIEKDRAPLFVDLLSCNGGCSSGPLSIIDKEYIDESDFYIQEKTLHDQCKFLENTENPASTLKEKLDAAFRQYHDSDLYKRNFINRWDNINFKYPDAVEINDVYRAMRKFKPSDFYNCTSCGYGNCERMAIAIFNGINKPENCRFYISTIAEKSHQDVTKAQNRLQNILDTSLDGFIQLDNIGLIKDANPALKAMLKKSDIIGKTLYKFVDAKNKAILDTELKVLLRNQQNVFELALTDSEGVQISCRISASQLWTDKKEHDGFFAVVSNISNLKQAEEELRRANEDLEQKVYLRTIELNKIVEDLHESQAQIEETNQDLAQQREEISSQRDLLEETMNEVAKSQKKLSDIVDCMPDPVMVIDRKGVVMIWNKEMELLTNIKAQDIIGKGNGEYAIPFYGDRRKVLIDLVFEPTENFAKKYSSVEKRGNILIAEAHMPHLKGGGMYMSGTATALYDEVGNVIGAIEIVRDITDRVYADQKIKMQQEEMLAQNEELKQMSEEVLAQKDHVEETMAEVQKAEQKLKSILDFIPNPIFAIDHQGVVLAWNKTMERLTKTNAEDIIGKGNYEHAKAFYGERRKMLADLVFEPDEEISQKYASIKREGNTLYAETPVKHLLGEDSYLVGWATPLLNEDGETIGAVELILDMSERKQAETLIKKQIEEIQAQREELWKRNEKISAINNTLEDQKKELEETFVALQQAHDKLKDTQSQLIQSEKMAALGKLIAGVAHEVNTPLGAIKSSAEEISLAFKEAMNELPNILKKLDASQLLVFTQLLEIATTPLESLSTREERSMKKKLTELLEESGFDDAQYIAGRLIQVGIYLLNEEQVEFLKNGDTTAIISVLYNLAIQYRNNQNVKLAVEKASRVILALKTYSHSDHDNVMCEFDIRKNLETVLTIYHNQIKKGVTLNKHYSDVPMVMAYPDKLNQVWTNIIQNALQAMNYNGTLTIDLNHEGDSVIVSFTDSGHGIPDTILERIFEPFFTTKAAGEGSGLGLDIVKKIVEEHNGKIWVKSVMDIGTTFFVSIPACS